MKTVDLYIDGEISVWNEPERGFISSKYVRDFLQKNEDAEEIIIHINSPGGDVSEGFAIFDLLKSSGKKINTIVEGICMSIATVVFLSGKNRQLFEHSTFMIHNPWGYAEGDADQVREYADLLEETEKLLINFYAKITGMDTSELDALMKKETYYSAEEAVKMGFATEVIKTVNAKAKINFKSDSKKMAKNKKRNPLLDKIKAVADSINAGVKALDLTLEDGTGVTVETDAETPAVGDAVTIESEPAPDGQHTLEDGTVITVLDGVITAIDSPTNNEKDDDEMQNSESNEALEGIADALQNLVKNQKTQSKILAKLVDRMDASEEANEEIAETLGLIGKNLHSNGFKHKNAKTKFNKKAGEDNQGDDSEESVKASAIKAARKKAGFKAVEEKEDENQDDD